MENSEKNESYTPHKRWVGCDVEEEFFGEERKSGKIERKRVTAKDRSKYKKTDLKMLTKDVKTPDESLLRGRVLSITPQGIVVEYENQTIICSLRGSLKKDRSQFKNLVTVGDIVLFERSADEGLIAHIEPRKSTLSRADNLSQRKEQLIASNIDQVLITLSVMTPALKPFLADRYIIAARNGNMTPILVVNKIDLLQESEDVAALEKERELYNEFLRAYKDANIPVISVSVVTGEGMDQLREIMKDKASVFSGQSGVGKSSLINAVADLDLRTGHIVGKTNKGTHTTSTANLLILPFGGWCIDTPGIKSFGVWHLKMEDIEPHFTEITKCRQLCKYPNCTHSHEQDCAVLAAVENGEISALRYQSYRYLLDSVSKEHIRR
jgi:ribosome biogenesis GTPase / thiamine phosphate phosphatase